MALIEVRKLTKSYRRERVLDNVSITVPDYAAACVVGRNGAGKSTLLSILAGILKPDKGELFIDGKRLDQAAKRIGYVPQRDHLFDDLSVRDNIAFWASASGLSKKEAMKSTSLELLGLEEFFGKKVSRLSGGMRRRTAIGAALLHNPDYLILDEPFAGLDLVQKGELINYLATLHKQKKTILYAAHDMDEIASLANLVFMLHGGTVTATNLDELTERGGKSVIINIIRGENE